MSIKPALRAVAALGLAATFASGGASVAEAQKKIRWKMASSYASTLDVIGPAGAKFADDVTKMSAGAFEVKFFEPNALVPPLQVFDATSQGSIDAAYTAAGFHAGKIPAAVFFSTVPFGPQTGEYLAWMKFGGGKELYDEIYGQYGVKGFAGCSINAPEASGWFRKEIKSVDDLRGLKMRFYGLGAKVMEKFGVSTQLLAPGDIYPALELGTLDATELSFPSMDVKMGFFNVAKHYYFPGWHQQSSLQEVIVNKKGYEALPEEFRHMLEVACDANATWSFGLAESRQFAALQEIKAKGVTVHTWPPEFIKALEAKWHEVIAEETAKDPVFKKVYESYSGFRKNYAVWKEVGYLK